MSITLLSGTFRFLAAGPWAADSFSTAKVRITQDSDGGIAVYIQATGLVLSFDAYAYQYVGDTLYINTGRNSRWILKAVQ